MGGVEGVLLFGAWLGCVGGFPMCGGVEANFIELVQAMGMAWGC